MAGIKHRDDKVRFMVRAKKSTPTPVDYLFCRSWFMAGIEVGASVARFVGRSVERCPGGEFHAGNQLAVISLIHRPILNGRIQHQDSGQFDQLQETPARTRLPKLSDSI